MISAAVLHNQYLTVAAKRPAKHDLAVMGCDNLRLRQGLELRRPRCCVPSAFGLAEADDQTAARPAGISPTRLRRKGLQVLAAAPAVGWRRPVAVRQSAPSPAAGPPADRAGRRPARVSPRTRSVAAARSASVVCAAGRPSAPPAASSDARAIFSFAVASVMSWRWRSAWARSCAISSSSWRRRRALASIGGTAKPSSWAVTDRVHGRSPAQYQRLARLDRQALEGAQQRGHVASMRRQGRVPLALQGFQGGQPLFQLGEFILAVLDVLGGPASARPADG